MFFFLVWFMLFFYKRFRIFIKFLVKKLGVNIVLIKWLEIFIIRFNFRRGGRGRGRKKVVLM